MRKIRIMSILLLFIFALVLMTGCTCVPSKEDWYFFSYKGDITFIGGVTLNVGFSDASHVYPFAGIDNQDIAISFSKDGDVVFTTKDGETLHGTFEYENEGIKYTSFTITLENGEIIEGSSANSTSGKKLALTYQGTIYNFTTEEKRSGVTLDQIVQRIIDGDIDSLNESQVVRNGDGLAVRYSDMVYYPITESTAVYAIQIYADGSYEILSELHEGDVLSTYTKETDYVVIYYIEK